jgi:hypothetical protein
MPKSAEKNGTPKQCEVLGLPEDVAAIRAEIRKFFATKDETGTRIGSYKHGVYAFYDYDGEPIYVFEKTRDRNIKWKNRKHRVPLCEGRLWVEG